MQDIAIVGFSIKFPGDGDTPEGFWSMLAEKKCVMEEWPTERFNLEAFAGRSSKGFVRGAHFMKEDCGLFDASFFGISGTEACAMDPQARLLLETAYRALENAGMPMEAVTGTQTAVFNGCMADDYRHIIAHDPDVIPKYTAVGSTACMLANRLSWFFDFRGPSVNLDSACSSSLMALDLACQSLRNGDSNMALVSGSNILIGIEPILSLMNMSFNSPDGRCFSFDIRANGYGRGEGVGVLVVKRLEDAVRDGDIIRAVIRSTGSNQDGHTPGLTQPSKESQARLILDTYKKAGLDRLETRFFEAHGTGTAIGDPIEADAIGSVFRAYRSREDPLYIGAVKSNIGHLEGGSGIAGIVKTILVLERGLIPPNANFEHLNPNIDAEFLNLRVPTELMPWPTKGLRRASVASFGFGGSNSHAVLDDAYHYLLERGLLSSASHCTVLDASQGNIIENGVRRTAQVNGLEASLASSASTPKAADGLSSQLLVFSTSDEGGIQRMANAYAEYFRSLPSFRHGRDEEGSFVKELATILAQRRSKLNWRSFAVADGSLDFLRDQLPSAISKPIRVNESKSLGLGYIFTGQGAQYRRMGVDLLKYPIFRFTIDQCQQAFSSFGCEWSIYDALLDPHNTLDINDPKYAQPLTTALQIALVELLASFGLTPRMVIGHSSGEIAAAYALGALSLDSACKVSYFRGIFASRLRDHATITASSAGAMLAVDLSVSDVEPYLDRVKSELNIDNIHVACINSPHNVTVSGDAVAIDRLKSILDSGEMKTIVSHRLRTGVAYHSPQMRQVATEYEHALADLKSQPDGHGPSAARMTMVSSVTGMEVEDTAILSTAKYWVENMISPVQFSAALIYALSQSSVRKGRQQRPERLGAGTRNVVVSDWVEIGPHSALKRPFRENVGVVEKKTQSQVVRYSSVLDRHSPAIQSLQTTAGKLFSLGYQLGFEEINQTQKRTGSGFEGIITNLPEYPFNHTKRYWFEPEATRNIRLRPHKKHELVGAPFPDSTPLESRWRKIFDATETPWLLDHAVNGKAIYPATGMIVMAIEGAQQLAEKGRIVSGYFLHDSVFVNPIVIKPGGDKTVTHLHMRPSRQTQDQLSHAYDFQIYTEVGDRWQTNCRGQISIQYEGKSSGATVAEQQVPRTNTVALQLQQEEAFYKEQWEAARRECQMHVPTSKVYKTFQGNGLHYGPSFQVMDDLQWGGSNISIGTIKPFEWTSEQSENAPEPHMVHPSTLDGLGQLGWVALTQGGEKLVTTGLVSTRVREAWISGAGASADQIDTLHAVARSQFKGLRGTDTSVYAIDSSGKLRLWISGMETTSMSSNNALVGEAQRRELCFSIDWKPDLSLMNREQLQDYCHRCSSQKGINGAGVETTNGYDYEKETDNLLAQYTRRTVEKSADYQARVNFPAHLQRYVEWLERKLATTAYDSLPDQPDIQTLEDRVLKRSSAGHLYVTFGRLLDLILEGAVEADPILDGEQGTPKHAAVKHRQLLCNQILKEDTALHRYIDALAHKTPQMRILEVNASNGSLAPQLIGALTHHGVDGTETHRFSHYTYTDSSDACLQEVPESLAALGRKVTYRVLDIDQDPVAQGFELASYDVVVSAWVSGHVRGLASFVNNARKLLKPGGTLLILDMVRGDALRSGFVFGTLPEWWEDTCTAQGWDSLLTSNGFSGVDISFPHDLGCSLMATTATGTIDTDCSPPPKRTVLVVDSESHLQAQVVSLLSEMSLKVESPIEVCSVSDMDTLSTATDGSLVVMLPEIEQPFLVDLDETTYGALHSFLRNAQDVIWVTAGNEQSPYEPRRHIVDGLARVLCTENDRLSFITAHLEDHAANPAMWARHIYQIMGIRLAQHANKASELDYREQNGVLHIGRVAQADDLNDALFEQTQAPPKLRPFKQGLPLTCTIANPGSVESKAMLFVEDTGAIERPLGDDEVEIEVKAVGVNFRDIFVLLGRLSDGDSIGTECSGVVTRVGAAATSDLKPGDRVCAVLLDCLRTLVRCHHQFVSKIPDTLSFAAGAAIPLGGVTAYHSLVQIARLRKGETVLIHSGAGGTGQMAIKVAQALGATVFATVGSDDKRDLLERIYGIPPEHIFYSRDTSFQRHVMRLTGGRGVDVVLNSLSGDGLIASWECVAPYGRFVELGKSDVQSNSKLPMRNFGRNVSFSVVAIDQMQYDRPYIIQESLGPVVEMVTAGTLQPAWPLQEFTLSSAEEAFRLMQSGKNVGKLVINMTPTDLVQYSFPPEATYLIAGGLGGLGRSAARWMASMGAKNLILLSRSGPKAAAAQELIRELTDQGVRVRAPRCDLTSSEALTRALEECKDLPPIRGCIQGTMVLQDTIFERLTFSQWDASLQAKVKSTENLHAQLPADLDFFILLSSLAGVIGHISQANYAAGNTFQDAFAAYRRSLGQRAVALDLGWMREVGVAAEQEHLAMRVDAAPSMAGISEAEFLALLERCCDPAANTVTTTISSQPQILVGVVTPAQLRAHGHEIPTWLTERSMFQTLPQESTGPGETDSTDDTVNTNGGETSPSYWHRAFARADSPAAAVTVVIEGLTRKLARSLSLTSPSEIDQQRSLALQGVDSLLAVEMRQWVSRAFGAEVSALDITSAPNLEELAGMVVAYSEVKFD
ncbi:type I Iterative Polyketide synthase (PKS) [Aspergillus brasiliensis]|uniref:Type I Iterative Polyketide synthase (PKS) n=1 Tax=Aspergillus brasiliensis TaxID=319629 RepID=A0A9W5YVA9_9EURO|nr:type I Iterative Polyketide synthase (PKS) [Aspergillus brasiliensis]